MEAPAALLPATLPGSSTPSVLEARPGELPRAGDWAATSTPMALGALLVGGGVLARFGGWLGKPKSTARQALDRPAREN